MDVYNVFWSCPPHTLWVCSVQDLHIFYQMFSKTFYFYQWYYKLEFGVHFQIVYNFIFKIDFIFDYVLWGVYVLEGTVPVVPADSRRGHYITWD